MTHAHSRRAIMLSAALSSLLALALLVLVPSARAANGFGELTRFGVVGENAGQLNETGTLALGVDSSNNDVYVLEEYKPEELTEQAGKKVNKRFFELQKFVPSGASYAVNASAKFEEVSPEGIDNPQSGVPYTKPGVDGLAVDPGKERVYLLTTDFREPALKVDVKQSPEGHEAVAAASTLFAFSTKESGSKLEPASGTKPGGVLTGPAELGAQSATAGKALLEPHGIALDPETHEVIILAHIDKSGAEEDKISSHEDHYVLQRVSESGTLGALYEDKKNTLKESPLELGLLENAVPTSPVVVSAGGKEHVYFDFAGLAEVPYNFSSAEEPKLVALGENSQSAKSIEQGIAPYPPFNDVEAREARAPQGGLLAASPEGYVFGVVEDIKHELPENKAAFQKGVLALSGANGAVVGWTGGEESQGESPAQNKCVLAPGGMGLPVQVAAGKEGKLFVLAPEFIRPDFAHFFPTEFIENEETEEEEEIPAHTVIEARPGAVNLPAVIELGPNGEGCPTASASGPVATQNGIEIKGEEAIRPATKVRLTSHVKQADATNVEWRFENESTKATETTVQSFEELRKSKTFLEPTVEHLFATAAKYKVTEKITSDDLAEPLQSVFESNAFKSPTLTLTRTLNVSIPSPVAKFVGPTALKVGGTANFENKSSDPNGKEGEPLEYEWNFDDGSPVSTAKNASHTYTTAGVFKVTLTVTDHLKAKDSFTQDITVTAEENENNGGGNPPGGGSPAPPVVTPPPPVLEGPKGGTGGVLSYQARVASTSITVNSAGVLTLKIDCTGQSSCTGSVTLKTASAVAAGAKHKSILTLATGSFSAPGGSVKTITLHLSSKARALLAHSHTLRAIATILARDSEGNSHTSTAAITLRAAKHH